MGKKVLVIGATGFIGSAVALALKQRGHEVHGLIRDPAKAHALEKGGVKLVVGNATNGESYKDAVRNADVIIDTTLDYSDWTLDKKVLSAVTSIVAESNGEKKTYIFTSGGLVYEGNDKDALKEDSPRSKKDFLQGRVSVEDEVLSSKAFHGVVIRPPMVIGGAKGHWSVYFEQAEKGKVSVFGTGQNVFSYIHVSDLVDAYVKVVEADTKVVSGQAFHFAEPDRITLRGIAELFAKGAGHPNAEVETGLPWGQVAIFDTNIFYDSSKAKNVLGWTPKHSLRRDAKIVYDEWKASGAPATW